MSLEFLNPALLWGLAAVSLPVVAHLLSKRRFDVVDWGAMQFLDLGKQRRRRVRIEELLLLLLRMAMIALLAFALARPTISGGFWANYVSLENRDTVFVVDSSNSMGRLNGEVTPHKQAKLLIRRLLKHARPGDTFALLDVRDKTRAVVGQSSRNLEHVTDAVDRLPSPAGAADLTKGIAQALEILSTTSHARATSSCSLTTKPATGVWTTNNSGMPLRNYAHCRRSNREFGRWISIPTKPPQRQISAWEL